jgi:uncharacterized coiled-coil protein SlyX
MSSGVKKLAQVAVGAVIGFAQGNIVGAIIGAGLAFYAAEQQEKLNTKSPLRDNEPSAQTLRSSKAPVRFILGRAATGGVLAWGQEQSGTVGDGEWLHMVYVLCEGGIDALENIYLGEEEIGTFGEFASYELVVNPTQVNAFLLANCPGWKESQIGRGLSFVRVSFRYSAEKFPSGIPDARFVVRGRNDIYDPRTGTSGYSANTALHILWYLRTRCGVPDDEIVFSTFASAANVCDETVTNADGSASPRYRTSCVIGADEQRTGVLQKLEAACAGKLIRVGGRWMLQTGAYYGPYDFEITEDMVVGTITGSTEPTNDSAINTVRGTFIDPSQSWTETDYPEVQVDQWVVEDGGEAAETLTFSYVTDPYQAQRLANIELRRRRAGGTISIPMNLSGYNCRPGRVIRVNLPSLNILGEFIVTNWSMGDKDGCSVSVAQYEPAIFSDAVGQPYNPIGFINLPTGGLGSPTNLKWTQDASAEVTQGILSWVPPSGIVKEYIVIVRQGATAIQSHNVPATSTERAINGLPSGSYTMSVAAVGPMARSGEATISVSVNGPPIPEACVVQSSIDSITLIPSNTLRGLNGGTYEYFFSTVPASDPDDAVYLGQGLSFTHTGLGFYTNYYYFVRSSNAYGKSAFLYVPASTSNDVGAYLDALEGEITDSHLGQHLLGRIELIDGPSTLPGSVNNRVNELGEQIGEVTDHLQELVNEGQVALSEAQQAFSETQTDLQLQIDQVSTLAKSAEYQKEKAYAAGASTRLSDRLYQAKIAVPADASGAKSPPNATYWVDVGQVVSESNGLAARVNTTETKITSIEGVNTSQGTAITGLNNSLTTTNGNVTAAQNAANAANTLAGGKGKVIVQTAAPAAADQLAQNLWIDITGGANTPKRWTGSAWAAVTDKVATDAAAAAANALSVANTKADASAVNSLDSRVTAAEGTISSQGSSITGLNNSLTTTNGNVTAAQNAANAANTLAGGKGKVIVQTAAPATADQLAQNLWIDITGGANTPKRWTGSAWAAVTDKVATDAATAAANALSVANTKADAAALTSLTTRVTSAEGTISSQGTSITGLNNSLTTTNGNVTAAQNAANAANTLAGGKGKVIVQTGAPAAADQLAQNLWIDTTGGANTPKRWTGSAWAAVTDKIATDAAAAAASALSQVVTKADASAVTSLGTQVTAAEGLISSQGSSIVSLTNSIGDVGSENLFYNPAFVKLGNVTGVADGWAVNTPITPGASTGVYSLVPSWINASENAQRIDVTGLNDTNLYRSIIPVAAVRPAVQAGTSVALSVYFRATAGLQVRIYLEANNAAGNVLSVPSTSLIVATGSTQRATLLFANLPANTAKVTSFFRIFGGGVTAGFVEFTRAQLELGSAVSGWRDSTLALASDQAATSDALRSLTSTVTQQGTTLTSQSASLTSLNNSLTTTNTNVTAAQTAANAANTLAGGKGKVIVQTGAPAAADQLAQNLWIDITGGANTPKRWTGSAWVAVTDKVATDAATAAANALSVANTKASADSVSALSNTVSQQGDSLTAQGAALTSVQAAIGGLGASGVNLLPAEYTVFGPSAPVTTTGSFTVTTEADAATLRGYALRVESTNTTNTTVTLGPSLTAAGCNMSFKAQKYIVSFKARASVAGHQIASYLRVLNAAGSGFNTGPATLLTVTDTWARYSVVMDVSNAGSFSGDKAQLSIQTNRSNVTGRVLWLDQIMVEPVVNGVTDPSPFVTGNSFDQSLANASAVSALDARVAAAEGVNTSQSSLITSLNNSLTTTNTNVTAAQTAANAANTLAGGKGKVIVQTGAPAAADQLAQNLWIDITGGANTPKRWTGSAWVAVTDKVATDAAAAAASALSQVATKADASAVSSLTTRVTAAEGTISSQGSSITSLTNSLNAIGGDNLLPNSSFETLAAGSTTRPLNWSVGGTAVPTPSIVDSALPSSTKALRITRLAATNGQYSDVIFNSLEAARPKVTPGQPYTLSVWARGSAATVRLATYVQFLDAAGSTVLSTMTLAEVALTTTFTRYVLTGVAPAGAAFGGIYAGRMFNRSGGTMDMWMEVDNVQFQEGSVATAYAPSNERNAEALSAAISSLSSTVTSQGTTLTSQGNSLTQLTNRVGDVEGVNSGQATALNSLDTRVTSTEGKVTAQATAFQALQASSRDDNGEGDLADALKGWTSTAEIASESKVRTSETEAFAQRLAGFEAQIGANTANITELEQVVATNQSATATKIDQLSVTAGQNTAAIQQTSTAYADTAGKLNVMWSVKMQVTADGKYVAAGAGLGIENTGAGLQSQFLVAADRFAVVNSMAGGALSVPFAVQGGQVFMNSAFIQDGTITNAKIGSYISSTNYIAGQQGWVLYKDGTLEINGIVPGQGRLVINSQNVSVYDANNVLRVRLGYLG